MEEMYAFYVFGASLSYVGRVYSMSSARVKGLFAEAGLPVRDADDAMALYNAGGNEAADRRMAEFLCAHPLPTDQNAAPAPARTTTGFKSEDEDEDPFQELEWRVVALHELNWPVATIAQALGVSKRRTRALLRRNGLEM